MLDHNRVVDLLGSCDCACHRGASECWCNSRAAHPVPYPHRIAHNDAVHALGACPSPHHHHLGPVLCNVTTDPQWRAAIDRKDRRDQDRRIARGNIRNSSDVSRAIRMGVIPGARR